MIVTFLLLPTKLFCSFFLDVGNPIELGKRPHLNQNIKCKLKASERKELHKVSASSSLRTIGVSEAKSQAWQSFIDWPK